MTIRTRIGVTGSRLAELLQAGRMSLENVRAGMPIDRFNGYINWSAQQLRMLGPAVAPEMLNQLVTTPHYWMLCLLDPATKGNELAALIDGEIERQLNAFDAAEQEFVALRARHTNASLIIVADTNVYLHHPVSFAQVPWEELAPAGSERIQLVVPMLVIDELDNNKTSGVKVHEDGKETVRSRARTTLRELEARFESEGSFEMFQNRTVIEVRLAAEDARHVRLPHADNELVDVACTLRGLTEANVVLVSFDTGCRLRARTAGLDAVEPPRTRRMAATGHPDAPNG